MLSDRIKENIGKCGFPPLECIRFPQLVYIRCTLDLVFVFVNFGDCVYNGERRACDMIKVLIIEDEPLIAELYAKALGNREFEVAIANGSAEGIEMAKTKPPEIILLDIMMPEPNGIQVLEALKTDEVSKNIPVIMLTNLSGKNDVNHALSKGALGYWVKSDILPVSMGEKIKEALRKK